MNAISGARAASIAALRASAAPAPPVSTIRSDGNSRLRWASQTETALSGAAVDHDRLDFAANLLDGRGEADGKLLDAAAG